MLSQWLRYVQVVPSWLASDPGLPPAVGPSDVPSSASSTPPAADTEQTLIDWAAGLPEGAAPSAPYLVGTTLHLPHRQVELPGEQATPIGMSTAGAIVLDQAGLGEGLGYVLVTEDGSLVEMPPESIAPSGQGALISPQGDLWTAGAAIVDIATRSTVGQMPSDSDSRLAWTPDGIIFADREDNYFLWKPDAPEERTELEGFPGSFAPRSSFGIRHDRGCSRVVEATRDRVEERYKDCDQRLLSVSPDGKWALSDRLIATHLETGRQRPLTGAKVKAFPEWTFGATPTYVSWPTANEVVLSIPGGYLGEGEQITTTVMLVRCDVFSTQCERIARVDGVPVGYAGQESAIEVP